jgi:hypothetical protein
MVHSEVKETQLVLVPALKSRGQRTLAHMAESIALNQRTVANASRWASHYVARHSNTVGRSQFCHYCAAALFTEV